MKFLSKFLLIFIGVAIILIGSDYMKYNSFQWLNNIMQSFIFSIVATFVLSLLSKPKNKKEA